MLLLHTIKLNSATFTLYKSSFDILLSIFLCVSQKAVIQVRNDFVMIDSVVTIATFWRLTCLVSASFVQINTANTDSLFSAILK